MMLAQALMGCYSLGQWVIWMIVAAAIVAVLYYALDYFGMKVPPILIKIIGVVLVAILCVVAVTFLMHLAGGRV